MEPTEIDKVLAGITAATEADLTPRVVLTADVSGQRVSVVECVMPEEDGTARRGYLWHAVTGEFELRPARFEGYRPVPGIAYGATLISTSRKSARGALANARAVLVARARTARLQGGAQ